MPNVPDRLIIEVDHATASKIVHAQDALGRDPTDNAANNQTIGQAVSLLHLLAELTKRGGEIYVSPGPGASLGRLNPTAVWPLSPESVTPPADDVQRLNAERLKRKGG